MKSKGPRKQSKRYECQLLRKANTVWRNPGMTTDDVCLMFTWALKIAPGFPIHVGKIRHDKGITECWHTKFRHVRYVYFSESLQKHWKSIANRRVEDWETSNGHTKDTTRLFHGPWQDAVGEHICAQPFRIWNRLCFHMFMQVSQIFQRRKSNANKQDFENKFNLTCQAQSTPKTIVILTKVFCTSGLNFVVLAWTGDELSHGQAQNGVNFDFEVKFNLEGQGQPPPKTIGILTKVFYIYGPNLVILAETGHELSRGQARDWHTDGHTHTDTRRQRQYPKANTKKHWNLGFFMPKGCICSFIRSGGCNWLNIRVSSDKYSVLLSGKNSEGMYFIKYTRTLGNIAQTTWIIPPTIIYIKCVRKGAFTVSNTLVGRVTLKTPC